MVWVLSGVCRVWSWFSPLVHQKPEQEIRKLQRQQTLQLCKLRMFPFTDLEKGLSKVLEHPRTKLGPRGAHLGGRCPRHKDIIAQGFLCTGLSSPAVHCSIKLFVFINLILVTLLWETKSQAHHSASASQNHTIVKAGKSL